jgi:hypothetical protein
MKPSQAWEASAAQEERRNTSREARAHANAKAEAFSSEEIDERIVVHSGIIRVMADKMALMATTVEQNKVSFNKLTRAKEILDGAANQLNQLAD